MGEKGWVFYSQLFFLSMRRISIFCIVLFVLLFPAFSNGIKEDQSYIGVAVYRFDDLFISGIREVLTELSKDGMPLIFVDGKGNQSIQNDSILEFIDDDDCKAIIVNTVDRTSSGLIIEKAKKANKPLVFFNREPLVDDMARWDKVYYVGANAIECGKMAGQIFIDYYSQHPEVDKNCDGVIQYVMIKGEAGHQDTELRTEYTINTILDSGIQVERLGEESANWQRKEAYEVMMNYISTFGDRIEIVFSNNDEMALGAIEALLEEGYFNGKGYIPVIGVDGTSKAMSALENGTLLGTVFNDNYKQAEAIYNLATTLANGEKPTDDNIGYPIEDERYVWVPYVPIMNGQIAK